jgi:hypothetical protein
LKNGTKGFKMRGIVFFFEGDHKNWFCDHISYTEEGIRGYAGDGCWWMDYNAVTKTVNVCTASMGTINWDKPINTFPAKLVSQVAVPADVEGTPFELVKWAKNEQSNH